MNLLSPSSHHLVSFYSSSMLAQLSAPHPPPPLFIVAYAVLKRQNELCRRPCGLTVAGVGSQEEDGEPAAFIGWVQHETSVLLSKQKNKGRDKVPTGTDMSVSTSSWMQLNKTPWKATFESWKAKNEKIMFNLWSAPLKTVLTAIVAHISMFCRKRSRNTPDTPIDGKHMQIWCVHFKNI